MSATNYSSLFQQNKKILLIDADSVFPNLALMKLGTWFRLNNNDVTLVEAEVPYYPNLKKKVFKVPSGYDHYFCSIVFDGSREFIDTGNEKVIFGGTGYSLKRTLPARIEMCKPDYSLYPENDCSYGFITRGCIRQCSFCLVPEKEGGIRKVFAVQDIVQHSKVKFLDNNILAWTGSVGALSELIDMGVKCQFVQGLDIRLVDERKSDLLSRLNYWGEYYFAFDLWNSSLRKTIAEKLKLMSWRKEFGFRFFVYVHPKMDLEGTVRRVRWLRGKKCIPYIMRDISCWTSPHSEFFTDLAAWCNQPGFFKHMGFEEFLIKRYPKNTDRVGRSFSKYRLA